MAVFVLALIALCGTHLFMTKSTETDTNQFLSMEAVPVIELTITDNDINTEDNSGDKGTPPKHISDRKGHDGSNGHPDDTNTQKSGSTGHDRVISEQTSDANGGNRDIGIPEDEHHNSNRHSRDINTRYRDAKPHSPDRDVNTDIHGVHKRNPDVNAKYQDVIRRTQSIRGRNPDGGRQNYKNWRGGYETGNNLGVNEQNHSTNGHNHGINKNNRGVNWLNLNMTHKHDETGHKHDGIGRTSIVEEGAHGVRIRRQAQSMNITWTRTTSCNTTAELWRDIQADEPLFKLNATWSGFIQFDWVNSRPNMTFSQWKNELPELTTIPSWSNETQWLNTTGLGTNGSSDLLALPWLNRTRIEAAWTSENDTQRCPVNNTTPTGIPVANSSFTQTTSAEPATSTATPSANASTTTTVSSALLSTGPNHLDVSVNTEFTQTSTHVPPLYSMDPSEHMPISWPAGSYSLPMCGRSCPGGLFRRGNISTGILSKQVNTLFHGNVDYGIGFINTSNVVTIQTCVMEDDNFQDRTKWPQGRYCVFAGNSTTSCPHPLERGKITVEMRTHDNSTLNFCCINSNSDYSTLSLPPLKPFYLMPLDGQLCPKVDGMALDPDSVEIIVTNNSTVGAKNASLLYPQYYYSRISKKRVKFSLHFCHYAPRLDTVDDLDENGDFSRAEMTGALVACVVTSILLTTVGCFLYKRRQKKRARERHQAVDGFSQLTDFSTDTDPVPKKLDIGNVLKLMLSQETQVSLYALLLHSDKLEMLNQIGKGAFGTVYYGRYKPDENPLHNKEVAIKTLKDNCGYAEINGLIEESLLMSEFHHPNVMGIVGVSIKPETEVPLLVLLFMKHGDLQSYLRKFRYEEDKSDQIPDVLQLLSFCLQIARGMEYLANMKFVHRDLAARNCMLDSNMVVKVADFGLARDIYSSSYYRQDRNKLLPIKWMAVESLQDRVFTPYSDVWSYGVTVWEIVTLGKVPYPDLENSQVIHFLEEGNRLKQPDSCPVHLYDLMLRCWLINHKDRPTFTDIVKELEDTLTGLCDYLDLDEPSKLKQELTEESEVFTNDIISAKILTIPETHELSRIPPAKALYQDYRELV